MRIYFARVAQAAVCGLLASYGPVPSAVAATLPVPFLQAEKCELGGDLLQRFTYLGPPNAPAAHCLPVATPSLTVLPVMDVATPRCSVWRMEESSSQPCGAIADRMQGAVPEAGSPRALGALVAALTSPVESDVEPLMKPTPPLLVAEWTLVLTILGLGLFRIALGRRE